MNRRNLLKTLGAMLLTPFVPAVKTEAAHAMGVPSPHNPAYDAFALRYEGGGKWTPVQPYEAGMVPTQSGDGRWRWDFPRSYDF